MKTNSIATQLQQAISYLQGHSDSARLDAELLLAHCLQKDRTYLHAWPDYLLTPTEVAHLQQLLSRRHQGEPVAYILGHKEFWSLDLVVNHDTLIPRPETELLVATTLALLPADKPLRIADLGTGSGAIALAIAHERPQWHVLAVDASVAALHIAKMNAERLKLTNIDFLSSNWYQDLPKQRFHAIVSNPPYLAADDPHLQGDIRFEPSSALISQDSGLQDFYTIIAGSVAYLEAGGYLLLEHGYNQAQLVADCFKQHGFSELTLCRDLQGLPRMSYGRRD